MKPVSEEPRCESSESGSSQFLTIQTGSKVVFNKTLFSTSEDLDLMNKFSTVFTIVVETEEVGRCGEECGKGVVERMVGRSGEE